VHGHISRHEVVCYVLRSLDSLSCVDAAVHTRVCSVTKVAIETDPHASDRCGRADRMVSQKEEDVHGRELVHRESVTH
jgi:hypothetical protein